MPEGMAKLVMGEDSGTTSTLLKETAMLIISRSVLGLKPIAIRWGLTASEPMVPSMKRFSSPVALDKASVAM